MHKNLQADYDPSQLANFYAFFTAYLSLLSLQFT